MNLDEVRLETLSSIENFDSLAKEHWDDFANKPPTFKKAILGRGQVITARVDVRPVGYLVFLITDSPFYDEKWCSIGMYFLQREHRGRGLGTKMFLLLEQTAKEAGCSRIVSSYNLKQPLENFYANLGFSATHVAIAKEI
jgi:GNAT superfamily N-acetyltransferase